MIRIRDELCKNGEILMSPALSYSGKHLHSDVDKEKKEKLPREFEEDKVKREEEKRGARFENTFKISISRLLGRNPKIGCCIDFNRLLKSISINSTICLLNKTE